METAVVLVRWAQYVTCFVLAGGALFALYALPAAGPSSAVALGWPRRLLAGCAALLVVASLLGLVLQTAVVAGSLSAALDPSILTSVISEMAMGAASLARALAAVVALHVLLLAPPGRAAWIAVSTLGLSPQRSQTRHRIFDNILNSMSISEFSSPQSRVVLGADF